MRRKVRRTCVGLNNGVLALNKGASNSGFQVNVRGPFTRSKAIVTILPMSSGSVMSSKGCRQCFGGSKGVCRRVLSPSAKCPVRGGLGRIAVVSSGSISKSTLDAAYCTLKLSRKLGLVQDVSGVRTMFVASSGVVCGDDSSIGLVASVSGWEGKD